LGEGFGEHRPAVCDAVARRKFGHIALARHRGDAIHHRVGEARFFLDPCGECGIGQRGEIQNRAAQHIPVVLDVVAAERGEWFAACGPAAAIGFGDDADDAARIAWTCEVMGDQSVVAVEQFGRAVQGIAMLRHRRADDADVVAVDRIEQRGRTLAREDHPRDRADDRDLLVAAAALDQGVEPILCGQDIAHPAIGRHQSGADNAPVPRIRQQIHQRVGVACHMGAMKAAEAEMHDPRRDGCGIVSGTAHGRGKLGQDRARKRQGRHGFYPRIVAIKGRNRV
jgi:hypothetical protein